MAEEVNWDAHRQMSPIIDAMIKAGEPLTRENYIRNAYGDLKPEEWTGEHEAELPEPFRRTED